MEKSAYKNRADGVSTVIGPWLMAGLATGLAASVLLSAVLIIKLSRFDEAKRQAEAVESRAGIQRAEMAKLQVEVESLTKQKDTLAPTIADWQQRLKEKSAAEAVLATLDAKQRQMESDIAQAGKRLEDANRAILEAEKQKTELNSTIERLKSDQVALGKSTSDAKALARMAVEAEQRLNDATNAITNIELRRKRLETDANSAQTRFEQLQTEADDLRQAREKLNTQMADLRQQIQAQKDLLSTFEQKAGELKALQTKVQLEEQKLAKAQEKLTTADARATELELRQTQAVSEFAQMAIRLDQARKDGVDAEARWDAAKAGLQKADTDLAAARTQLQVFVVKQGELTRETSRMEGTVERLKKEKEALEKEIGRLESQLPKVQPEGQK